MVKGRGGARPGSGTFAITRHGKTEELFYHTDGKKCPKLTTPTGLDLDAHACNFTRAVLEMSSRKGFRLPPSKLISRSGGKRKEEYVYRRIPNSQSFTKVEDTTSTSSSVVSSTYSTTSVTVSTMSEASSSYNPSMNELSCYEIESRASLAGWESIRK